MWAGAECTINRVGDTYRDQSRRAGAYDRDHDVEHLIALGVKAVRFPVLWERHEGNAAAWQATDRALARLRDAGIEPIVGLTHHGSGIDGATLLDSAYPARLAAFAATVARRHPWVTRYTPVNEPLTTARFAALYGLWYPHHASDRSFVAALLHQTLAVQQSMRAIRDIAPGALLIATEDLGFTHAPASLEAQAAFENERRWLTWDLLLGRVTGTHALAGYLAQHGDEHTLDAIINRAPEDAQSMIVGINHYLTSERHLDSALHYYPRHTHGGNGRERYADVEAVRVLAEGVLGVRALLLQAWMRYNVPIAITEAHLGCTREQQMQWLAEVWQAAHDARADGADVRAVTAWAAFGSFDWNSLLTRDDGVYECGLFDLRAPAPRPTALAAMVTALGTTGTFDHPALHAEPWWRRDARLHYPAPLQHATVDAHRALPTATIASTLAYAASHFRRRPLLITGARGTLGHALVRLAGERGLPHRGLARDDLDITNAAHIEHWLDAERPWAVINAAGWVRVDDAERERDACVRANAQGAEALALACAARGIRFVTFSSDLVFDGDGRRPLVESDATAPLNVYGHSKDEGERLVRLASPDVLVVRTSAFFGDWDRHNFVSHALQALHNGERVQAPSDAVVSPTYVTDLVHAVLDLLLDGEGGTWHLANSTALTWTELATTAAHIAGLNARKVEACLGADIGWTAPRPRYSALGSERGSMLPSVEHALERWVRARAWERLARSA